MNFDFNDDQREIKQTAKELLGSRSTLAAVRAAAESEAYDERLWQELVQLGWPGIAISEQDGGSGLGVMELAILLEESGYALAASPLLSSACAALTIDIAGSEEQRSRWLAPLASGSVTGAFGMAMRSPSAAFAADAEEAAVIVIFDPDGEGARLIERQAATVRPSSTIDPTRRYAHVEGEGEQLGGDVARAFSCALVAISAELVGVCQRALEMTVAYVSERKQFDRPVGSFQAVSHRCAEMLLGTEGARSASYAAAWSADTDLAGLAEAAALAKLASSEAGCEVTASAIQAHGGIGFTWEADVHWLYKRAELDASLLGGASLHRRRLAALAAARIAAGRPLAAGGADAPPSEVDAPLT